MNMQKQLGVFLFNSKSSDSVRKPPLYRKNSFPYYPSHKLIIKHK